MDSMQDKKIDLLSPWFSVEESVNIFNSVCSDTLDQVAPLRQVNNKRKPTPWLNEQIRSLRRECRRCERKWKKDKLQISYEMLKDSLSKFQRAVKSARTSFFVNAIEKNRQNP